MTAMSLTTSFGTRMVIRNPTVTDHEWGPTIEGWAMVEDSLIEEWVIVRLNSATNVQWWPNHEEVAL